MTLLFLPLDIKIVSYLCLQPPAMKSGGKKKVNIFGFLPGLKRSREDRKNKYSVCDLKVVDLPQ